LTNGLEVLGLHYYKRYRNRTCGATTGTVVYQQLPIRLIDEDNETFSIASGTAQATGTISDNDALN
jgi:hypothetical protein